jgi:hypothetical protein
VKRISVFINIHVETENISPNRYVTKDLLCYISAECHRWDPHYNLKTSLWFVRTIKVYLHKGTSYPKFLHSFTWSHSGEWQVGTLRRLQLFPLQYTLVQCM